MSLGPSKGHGFQGVVKRHGFGGVGQTLLMVSTTAHVSRDLSVLVHTQQKFSKDWLLGGQMGGQRVTTQNLQVLKVIPEHNLLLIKGSVPGYKGSIVIIEK